MACQKGYPTFLKASEVEPKIEYLERLVDGRQLTVVVPPGTTEPGFALELDVVRYFCSQLEIPLEEFGFDFC